MVAATRQVKEPENTRLTLGDYFADVIIDARESVPIYHWIVQKVGSAAIVFTFCLGTPAHLNNKGFPVPEHALAANASLAR